MGDPAVVVPELAEFRRELRAADERWVRELGRTHRELAQWLEPKAQSAARGLGGPPAHFAGDIRGRGTATAARLEISQRSQAAFWGAKGHSGWYAARRYWDSRPQHAPWVGNSWDVGSANGPYAINPTIGRNLDEIVERYGEALDRLAQRAFPD